SGYPSLGYGVMEEHGPFHVYSDENGRAMEVSGGWVGVGAVSSASLRWGFVWEEWLAAVRESDAAPFIHNGGFWKQGLELPM
ncbi:hypothetical protein U1Q18_029666, partial [Sarracenia purpurea var. burkii]